MKISAYFDANGLMDAADAYWRETAYRDELRHNSPRFWIIRCVEQDRAFMLSPLIGLIIGVPGAWLVG